MNRSDEEQPSRPRVRRLTELLGMRVFTPDGGALGHVNDVRLAPGPVLAGTRAELVVDGLLIAGRHAGSLLGYDRREEQGPRIVRVVVRALHRNARYVPWSAVADLDWANRRIHLITDRTEPLSPA